MHEFFKCWCPTALQTEVNIIHYNSCLHRLSVELQYAGWIYIHYLNLYSLTTLKNESVREGWKSGKTFLRSFVSNDITSLFACSFSVCVGFLQCFNFFSFTKVIGYCKLSVVKCMDSQSPVTSVSKIGWKILNGNVLRPIYFISSLWPIRKMSSLPNRQKLRDLE